MIITGTSERRGEPTYITFMLCYWKRCHHHHHHHQPCYHCWNHLTDYFVYMRHQDKHTHVFSHSILKTPWSKFFWILDTFHLKKLSLAWLRYPPEVTLLSQNFESVYQTSILNAFKSWHLCKPENYISN